MSPSGIDCMGCLVNAARGLEVMDDVCIRWHGVVHAAVWTMGSGHVAAACSYELRDIYRGHIEWRFKGQHGSH